MGGGSPLDLVASLLQWIVTEGARVAFIRAAVPPTSCPSLREISETCRVECPIPSEVSVPSQVAVTFVAALGAALFLLGLAVGAVCGSSCCWARSTGVRSENPGNGPLFRGPLASNSRWQTPGQAVSAMVLR